MKRHLFRSRKIFKMLEPFYNENPCYETMRHIALQMFAEGYKVGKEHAEKKLGEQLEAIEEDNLVDESFRLFWEQYDKKVDKPTSFNIWKRLSKKDRAAVLEYVPLYVKATPDKKYRKNPVTFLRHKAWLDELIPSEYADREWQRRKRTGEAEELASQLAHFKLNE